MPGPVVAVRQAWTCDAVPLSTVLRRSPPHFMLPTDQCPMLHSPSPNDNDPFPSPVNIPVIGFNAVLMSEHFASFAVFGILHAAFAIKVRRCRGGGGGVFLVGLGGGVEFWGCLHR